MSIKILTSFKDKEWKAVEKLMGDRYDKPQDFIKFLIRKEIEGSEKRKSYTSSKKSIPPEELKGTRLVRYLLSAPLDEANDLGKAKGLFEPQECQGPFDKGWPPKESKGTEWRTWLTEENGVRELKKVLFDRDTNLPDPSFPYSRPEKSCEVMIKGLLKERGLI